MNFTLNDGDKIYWGKSWHNVLSSKPKGIGKLEVFCRDGLLVTIKIADYMVVK